MTSATPESLSKFVNFYRQHITGQERKEAQIFLDRFFGAFGHEGALEAGATYEEAIKKSSKTGKTGFADLVWKPRVLIEMKKRGEDLNKHYSQAFDYWTRLVPNRPKYVILEKASEYQLPFQRVKEKVKPERDQNRRDARRINWWKFGEKRPAMRQAMSSLSYYFAIPKIAKWVIFTPVDISILPCEANMVIASDDFYILGILTSNLHRMWVKAQSSTLEDRTRYTNTTCFETFPFPQTADIKIVEKIRTKAKELHQYRTQQMEIKQWGITTLYNKFFNEPSSQLYKLHQQLDKLIMDAYKFKPEDDILEKLLTLNLELAEKEKQGIKIIGPCSPN